MKNTKRLLALFLALALMLAVLTGCSGGDSGSSKESSASASAPEESESAPGESEPADSGEEEAPEDEPIHVNPYEGTEYPEGEEIVLWSQSMGDIWVDFFEKSVHEYNLEGRGYTIREEFIAGSAWDERIAAARASDTCPTAYIQSYNHIPTGVKEGYYGAFDDYMDSAVFDDMLPIVKEMVSIGGKTYAIPLLCEPSMVLYYRKDLLQKGNYTQPPKTWQELIDMANALKTDEVFGLEIPGFGDMGWSTWGMQFGNTGHGPINDNWDAPLIDDGYRDIALFFKELYDTGAVPEQPLAGYTDIKPFGQGDVVFQICGSWAVTDLINTYPEVWENTGVAVVPTQDGNLDKTTATIGGWVYVLDSKAEKPEGAADYLSWLVSSENPERLGQYYVDVEFAKASPFASIAAWAAEQAGDGAEYVDVINRISSYGQPEAAYPWDISARVASLFEDVAMGYDDIDNALKTCAEDIQQLIDDNNLPGTDPRK